MHRNSFRVARSVHSQMHPKTSPCVHRISPRLFPKCGLKEAGIFKVVFVVSLLIIAGFSASAADDDSKPKNIAVIHPNLLLNRTEIEQIKRKVQDHPWAARLL